MKLKPLEDRVVVERETSPDKTPGGIFLPETSKTKTDQGKVVAVGPGLLVNGERQKPNVMVGDRVLFGKYSGHDVTVDDKEYLVLREGDILATVMK